MGGVVHEGHDVGGPQGRQHRGAGRRDPPLKPRRIRRSWVFRFMRQGKAREMGLAPSPPSPWPRRGRPPAPIHSITVGSSRRRQRPNSAATFASACDAYIAAYEAGWGNAKHRRQWRASLDCACKILGLMAVDAIDTEAVLRVLQPIWNQKPATASRLRGRIARDEV
jgi:hypothetical protein